MINLSDPKDVKSIQSTIRSRPISDPEVMKFLEELCGWFDFREQDERQILLQHGKRQVLATLKTLLDCTPEQVAYMVNEEL